MNECAKRDCIGVNGFSGSRGFVRRCFRAFSVSDFGFFGGALLVLYLFCPWFTAL